MCFSQQREWKREEKKPLIICKLHSNPVQTFDDDCYEEQTEILHFIYLLCIIGRKEQDVP